MNHHLYADDTQIYTSCQLSDVTVSCAALELCLNKVSDWMSCNRLKLNHSKTEFIIYSSKYSNVPEDLVLHIGDFSVTPSEQVRNLGVIMDKHMSMNAQVKNVCSSAMISVRHLGKIRPYLTDEAAKSVAHALITSKVDNCNSLLAGLPASTLKPIQRVLNITARIVSRCPKHTHVPILLKSLHWLPANLRVHFKVLLLLYKALKGNTPYLKDLVQHHQSRPGLRSGSDQLLHIPRTRVSYGDRSFASFACRAYNSLPRYIRNSLTTDCFKSRLKTHLFNSF